MRNTALLIALVGTLFALTATADAAWEWRQDKWVYVKEPAPAQTPLAAESPQPAPPAEAPKIENPPSTESAKDTAAPAPAQNAKDTQSPAPPETPKDTQPPPKAPAAKETPPWARTDPPQATTAAPVTQVAATAQGQPEAAARRPEEPKPIQISAGNFPVSEFVLAYGNEARGLPPLAELKELKVELGQSAAGYGVLSPAERAVRARLGDLGHGSEDKTAPLFSAGALLRINEQIVAYFNRKNIYGVLVTPGDQDITQTAEKDEKGAIKSIKLEDKRAPGNTVLHLVIFVGRVTKIRSIAFGERVKEEDRINNPVYARLLKNSPIKPVTGQEGPVTDLIDKDALDRYVLFLNRHPGRRADVSLSSASASADAKPGEVALDYLISENKPWVAYQQTSNTGTKQTSEWRYRFGFIDYQFSNNDDILALDYTTAGFDQSHAGVLSYEAPILGLERVRWSVHGAWSRFMASDVGAANGKFSGTSQEAGGELIVNFFQARELFVDFLLGARWENVSVLNQVAQMEGRANFFIPNAGLRVERVTDTASTRAYAGVEWLPSGFNHNSLAELEKLGRLQPDESWTTLVGSFTQSFYLEPLLNRKEWESADPKNRWATLAHELLLNVRGRSALGHRLVPQFEETVGGLYSVRGYPESVVAGDSVVVGTVEYMYHFPRTLGVRQEPTKLFGSPFRYAPQSVYGSADWDLIFRVFYDVGRVVNSKRLSIEQDATLMGAGCGVELQLKRNLSIRVDYGQALMGLPAQDVEAGDRRLNIVVTLTY